MHGRVKVRTSEEEKVRKEKERKEKLKVYKHVMHQVQYKRTEGELDQELLELTGKILVSNPDIYTLWNIRRETMLLKKKENNEEELTKLYKSELDLTEYCLKINPKSYCAWHQREWVLLTMPEPDWQKELLLCNNYIKLDERNFHTWDYRRFVVSQCKPTLSEEFQFTTEKLHDNFSNYSAWHYRSRLLVELHPDLKGGRPIQDSHHKHELKMVQNAAFTDPDDTSAWFYQRWLLGAVKTETRLVVCAVTPKKTTVAFSHYVDRDFVLSNANLFFNNALINGVWTSCTGNKYDILWELKHSFEISDDLNIKVGNKSEVLTCIRYKPFIYIGKSEISFQRNYSEPVIQELKEQLESCRQLYMLEPDSKWTLLTTTVFLHYIDAKQHHKEVISNLHQLKKVDKLRAGYYDDLVSKWTMEDQLATEYNNNSLEMKILFDHSLTSLPHLQYYSHCEVIDLSNQKLSSKVLPSLIVLQHCKVLSLENNNLDTLQGFPTLNLVELNLKQNPGITTEEMEQFKKINKYKINC